LDNKVFDITDALCNHEVFLPLCCTLVGRTLEHAAVARTWITSDGASKLRRNRRMFLSCYHLHWFDHNV